MSTLADIYQPLYANAAQTAAEQNNIPPSLFTALINQESGWNPNAISSEGAIGLTQLMPSTAQSLGVDPNNTLENIQGGAQYLGQMFSKFGNWTDALRAYNVGPTAAAADPNAGLSYAQAILSNAPGVTNSNTINTLNADVAPATPSIPGNPLSSMLNPSGSSAATSNNSTNGGFWSGFWQPLEQWLTGLVGGSIWSVGLLLAAIGLLYFGLKSLVPNGGGITLDTRNLAVANLEG